MNTPSFLTSLLFVVLCVGCQDSTAPTGDNLGEPAGIADQGSPSGAPASASADDAFMCLINNDVAGLEKLLLNGLDPDACPNPERDDTTLLHFAASLSSESIILALVDAGADVDAKTDLSVTPLLAALFVENSENAIAFIESGADVNLANSAGAAPLHFAVSQSDLPVVQALIEHGADVNAKTGANGGTPLSTAVAGDSLAIVEYLLENGADANVVDGSGKKPAYYAKSDAMRLLLGSESDQQE